ncbi:hypothetical protein JOC25_002592 [Solibacillus kalamii]|uniref:Putative endonuclease Z1 domain-containing protein n=2 Tax=Solibacillus kalamii TaxID=1748298 RepID=A0ABX3ZG18_9BACL|nr:hypothetical protein [Solibacillus kalamii]OUZ38597.1 hypothetical protein CBM15_12675 [Solibacillus kalamii]
MLLHIDYKKNGHKIIKKRIQQLTEKIVDSIERNEQVFFGLLNRCYANLYKSKIKSSKFPSREEVIRNLYIALKDEVKTLVINSDQEKSIKYDETGEMVLDTPYTVFIGAYAVTRGVTFKNLISFVFGRNSKEKCMDTSIQQLRVLGYRTLDDLSVTRMYATYNMVQTWFKMYELEQEFKKCWANYEKTRKDIHYNELLDLVKMGVSIDKTFKVTNSSKIPKDKVKVKPNSFIVIKDFDVHKNKKRASKYLSRNRAFIKKLSKQYGIKQIENSKATYITAEVNAAKEILKNVHASIEGINGNKIGGFTEVISVLEKYNYIHIYTKDNRGRSHIRQDDNQKGRYDLQPHSGQDKINAKKISNGLPVLMVLIQNPENGSSFSVPVIWLVLYVPSSFDKIFLISR